MYLAQHEPESINMDTIIIFMTIVVDLRVPALFIDLVVSPCGRLR